MIVLFGLTGPYRHLDLKAAFLTWTNVHYIAEVVKRVFCSLVRRCTLGVKTILSVREGYAGTASRIARVVAGGSCLPSCRSSSTSSATSAQSWRYASSSAAP